MRAIVIREFTRRGELQKVGTFLEDPEEMIYHLAEFVEVLPYLDKFGGLIIPFNSPSRFHWWQGGQSPSETLRAILAADKGSIH